MKLILIAGLPGSGKTTYAKQLRNELVSKGISCVLTTDPMHLSIFKDDYSKFAHTGDDVWIIESPYLCRKHDQDALIDYITKNIHFDIQDVKWIVFENNPIQCLANIEHRQDGRDVLPTIKLFSRDYHIPDSAQIIPVWSSQPTDSLDL